MKWTATLLLILASATHAEIFQCSPGVFTDKPCEGGKTIAVKQTGNPAASGAKIDFNIEQKSYPVHGADYLSAFTALKATGKFNAWAQWRLTHSYKREQTEHYCQMTNLVITVNGSVLMPNWVEHDRAPRRDQEWWDTGQRQLQIHEDGHIQHGKDAAILLRERLLGLSSSSCEAMDQKATAALTAVSNHLAKLDQDYDRLTMHGLRQFNHD